MIAYEEVEISHIAMQKKQATFLSCNIKINNLY